MNVGTIYKTGAPYAIPVLIILFLFSLKNCHDYAGRLGQYARNLDSVAATAKTYKNALGQQIAENKQIQIESAADLKAMTDTIFNLKTADAKKTKQVTEYARINQELRLQIQLAPWDNQSDTAGGQITEAPEVITADSGATIRVPAKFHYDGEFERLRGVVTVGGVKIDSLTIWNRVDLRILTKKTGFLNLGRESTVQVLNSNPDITTTGVLSIAVPPTLNWWQRIGKPVAFAILGGVIVSTFK